MIQDLKVLQTFFRIINKKIFNVKVVSLIPHGKISVSFLDSDNTYCYQPKSQYKYYRMVIGSKTVKEYTSLPDNFRKAKDIRPYVKPINIVMQALFYHEMGHLLFTDMVSQDIQNVEASLANDRPFIHAVFNVIEDIVIERYCMSVKYPYMKKYFTYMDKVGLQLSKQYQYIPQDQSCFINFLLCKLRYGKKFVQTNQEWEDNKKTLIPMINDIIIESNPTERIKKSIELARWLLTNIKWKQPIKSDNPLTQIVAGAASDASGSLTPTQGITKAKRKTKTLSKELNDDNGAVDDKQGDIDTGEATESEEDEIDEPFEYDPKNDKLIEDLPEAEEKFNRMLTKDIMCDDYIEMWVRQEVISNDAITQRIENILRDYASISNSIATTLRVFKDRIRPRYQSGFTSGKLNLRRVMTNHLSQGCNLKLYDRKICNGIAPDVAMSIMCDVSGSMMGNQSYVCTRAMMALAKACDLAKIPLEITIYTNYRGKSILGYVKTFDESLEDCKPFLGISSTDFQYEQVDTQNSEFNLWNGTPTEVCMWHYLQSYKKNLHKDKIMILITDGDTSGSTEDFKDTIQEYKKNGIHTIGIGIQSRSVEKAFEDYKLFDTEDSLQELPSFLTSTLLHLTTGGK